MRLKNHLPMIQTKLLADEPRIRRYAETLKLAGGYNDYYTRLSADILHMSFTWDDIDTLYQDPGTTDTHVINAIKHVLKNNLGL